MAVTLYTGLVGAGKTFEVVRSVILPALVAGRAVVSNIDGLNVEAIRDYLDAKGTPMAGELRVVDRLDIRRSDFFPERLRDGSYQPSAFVPLGALVVVDEASYYWGAGSSILPTHLLFFREHRHIVAEDGTACDLVVITQTVQSLHRSLSGLVESSLDVGRLNSLGLNRKYTVVSYQGSKRASKFRMATATYTYDRAIFPLYKSFSGAGGRVSATDGRFSIWSARWFWVAFALAPFILAYCIWHLWGGWSGHHSAGVASAEAATAAPAAAKALPVASRAGADRPSRPVPVPPHVSEDWHVAGTLVFKGEAYAVLIRPGFPQRVLPLGLCQLSMGAPLACRDGDTLFEPASPVAAASSPRAAPSVLSRVIGGR